MSLSVRSLAITISLVPCFYDFFGTVRLLFMSCTLCLSISLVRLLLLVDGKDGSPTGVVQRGGAHKTCSVRVH